MTKIEGYAFRLARQVADENPDHPLPRDEFIAHLSAGFLQALRTVSHLTYLEVSGMRNQTIEYTTGRLL